jgi:hypothetical protein
VKDEFTMTRWIIAVAAILMLFASASFGQGFVVNISYYGPPTYPDSPPLTTVCDGTTPLPDGRIIRIFHDRNPVGPDPTDLQPVICNNPPDCEDGPVGRVNFNEFTVNGVESGNGAGYFYTARNFASAGGLPTGSPYYYLRIYEPDGVTVLWTSEMMWMGMQGYYEIHLTAESWTCGQGGVQCLVIDETE